MARTYDLNALLSNDPASAAWALAWVRAALRDTPNEVGSFPTNSFLDAEITAALELNAVSDHLTFTSFYPAHLTAASLLEGDPTRVVSFSGGGWGETYVDPEKLARAIMRRGKAIDALISSATGGRIRTGDTSFRVVF